MWLAHEVSDSILTTRHRGATRRSVDRALLFMLESVVRTRGACRVTETATPLRNGAREARRDAVVGGGDRATQVLQGDDARQRDERDEQRILDQILAVSSRMNGAAQLVMATVPSCMAEVDEAATTYCNARAAVVRCVSSPTRRSRREVGRMSRVSQCAKRQAASRRSAGTGGRADAIATARAQAPRSRARA